MSAERNLPDLIAQCLPYDGPHSEDTVRDAAAGVSALVRYLNNATGPGNGTRALRHAATVDAVVADVESAVYGLDQLLRQLESAMDRQAADPSLYDDRHDRPAGQTADRAEALIEEARRRSALLADALQAVRQHTTHLGNTGGESE